MTGGGRKPMQRTSSPVRRVAADVVVEDATGGGGGVTRRAPSVLSINVQFDKLSRDQYCDLCDAVGFSFQDRRGSDRA
jgi:hypothetical protein